LRKVRRGIGKGAVSLGAALLLVCSLAAPASADPHDDKARVDKQVAQAQVELEGLSRQAQAAAAAYQHAIDQLPAAEAALADATRKVAAARAEAGAAKLQSTAAEARAQKAQLAFKAAEDKEAQARAHLNTFVVETYKGSSLNAFNALIDAGSPAQLAENLSFLDRLAARQQAAIDDMTRQALLTKQAHSAAEVAVTKAEKARVDAVQAVVSAENAAQQARQAQAAVARLVADRKRALADIDAQKAAVAKQYADLKAESDRIAAEIRNLGQPQSAPVFRPGARLLMPVNGWKSSDFGWRYDPYYHVWQLHAGVDLAAGMGSPIFAAASGRVLRAGWNGGYGNYTCILHGTYQGKSMATCYGHQSQILVHAGQQVSRGQVIGRVGSTGASTGPHLHFEVRLDGEPVQPLPWLPTCLC
jgi:murein DD-endopeptidase MepM/ murein hydrolase activator NlpD